LLRMTYKDLLIYGEAFWAIEKTILGKTPVRALRLHPKFMSPILDDNDNLLSWEYGPGVHESKPKPYQLDQMVHFRLDDPDTDLQGLSPLHSLQLTIASDLNAMHFNGNFFENSAQTGMVIIVKTSTGDEAVRNREWLEQNYVGTKNAHRPLLLEGDVDVKSSVNRQVDMQYVEGRILNRQEIMTALDIPPEKLNIVDDFRRPAAPGSGGGFHEDTIRPLQVIVEEVLSNDLIWTIFGWDGIVFEHNGANSQSDLDEAKLFNQYENMGVLSINQIAREKGWPEVEGGEEHFIQTAAGMIPVTMLVEIAKNIVAKNTISEPISGVGTTTTGQRNPPKADSKTAGVTSVNG
jgi:HK97 family phage portal protein